MSPPPSRDEHLRARLAELDDLVNKQRREIARLKQQAPIPAAPSTPASRRALSPSDRECYSCGVQRVGTDKGGRNYYHQPWCAAAMIVNWIEERGSTLSGEQLAKAQATVEKLNSHDDTIHPLRSIKVDEGGTMEEVLTVDGYEYGLAGKPKDGNPLPL